jgi:hypothetical protein
MTRFALALPILVLLAGCAELGVTPHAGAPVAAVPVVIAPAPPVAARTPEQIDTTTAAERQAAAAVGSVGQSLGQTVATLGDPSEAGFWLRTPLVSQPGAGQVRSTATGASAQVDLIPTGGPPGGGSEASLALMRLLEVPLTGLATLEVFAAR